MLTFLKNHPFPVEAYFESSLVLTFAFPREELKRLVPGYLELDCHTDRINKDQWAFIAVAMVQTKNLRPKGFPKILGNDFFLVGYRVFVKYITNSGKRLRGLYILKSETDKKKMEIMGNIFTHYHYSTTDIECTTANTLLEIRSIKSGFRIQVDKSGIDARLPDQSPFADWSEARRFAGPLPFSFTYDAARNKVVIIEGVRNNWTPRPVTVLDYELSFFDLLNIKNPVLASAFIVEHIPYYWKKGRNEIWKQRGNPSRV